MSHPLPPPQFLVKVDLFCPQEESPDGYSSLTVRDSEQSKVLYLFMMHLLSTDTIHDAHAALSVV